MKRILKYKRNTYLSSWCSSDFNHANCKFLRLTEKKYIYRAYEAINCGHLVPGFLNQAYSCSCKCHDENQ